MAFYIISAAIIATALLVILSKNAMSSALWLVACLFAQAALFAAWGAYLVAALQILLYAGAIMVLILFVIMMLDLTGHSLKWRTITGERIVIGAAGVYLAGILAVVIKFIGDVGIVGAVASQNGTVEGVGKLLLTKYAVPFEVITVLLLTTIVGAIATNKK